MSRPIVLLLPTLLALAHCTPPPPPTGEARAAAATLAACRTHSDAVYDRQHRDTIYTIGSRDSPFSGNDSRNVIDQGLSQRYGHENMVRECVRNSGPEADRPVTAVPEAGKP